MSQTLAGFVDGPRAQFTWSETTQAWVQVILPPWARRVEFSPQTNEIKVVVVHTDNTAITDGLAYVDDATHNASTVAGGAKYTIPVSAGRGNTPQCVAFIYAGTNPTVIECAVEENEEG